MRRVDDKHPVRAPHDLPAHQVVCDLMEQTRNLDLDFSQFCAVVGSEPEIAARIFRTARSVLVSRESDVEELRHAIAIIGLRRVGVILESLNRELEHQSG